MRLPAARHVFDGRDGDVTTGRGGARNYRIEVWKTQKPVAKNDGTLRETGEGLQHTVGVQKTDGSVPYINNEAEVLIMEPIKTKIEVVTSLKKMITKSVLKLPQRDARRYIYYLHRR